jgi:hypothetical protein
VTISIKTKNEKNNPPLFIKMVCLSKIKKINTIININIPVYCAKKENPQNNPKRKKYLDRLFSVFIAMKKKQKAKTINATAIISARTYEDQPKILPLAKKRIPLYNPISLL